MSTPRVYWNHCLACLGILCVLAGGVGCADSSVDSDGERQAERTGPPRVFTVNYPLAYFAQRIGGERIEVHFPGPPDRDPAYWTPDAETVERYQQADLILLNGADYAKWLNKVSLPEDALWNTTAEQRERLIEVTEAVTHTHGPEGEHAHTGLAFTTWLDFELAAAQAESVARALAEVAPEHADEFQANLASLRGDLSELDRRLRELTERKPDLPLVFSHPVYQYLERRYELNGLSVHWEPGAAPSDKMWSELDELLERHPARWMIWEDEPLDKIRRKLSERGVESVVFAPCANPPAEGDFLTVMRENIARLTPVFQ